MGKRITEVDISTVAPDSQECKIIILHVIHQAIKDYQHFRHKIRPEEIEVYESASNFLFDDEYMFDWGTDVVNLRMLCEHVHMDIDWLRNQVVKKIDLTFNDDGTIVPERRY